MIDGAHGHADVAGLAAAARREEAVLELVQLWIEPLHREDDAAVLVEAFLRIVPGHPRAVVLAAYLALHYWMDDEHLDAAADQLRGVLAGDAETGAAAMLLDEIRRRRGLGEGDVGLLRRSVGAELSWSLNHVRLGRMYAARGDAAAARTEFDLAVANLFEPDVVLDPVAGSFHSLFTGCLNLRDRVISERTRLA